MVGWILAAGAKNDLHDELRISDTKTYTARLSSEVWPGCSE